jgi:hypothetical protein
VGQGAAKRSTSSPGAPTTAGTSWRATSATSPSRAVTWEA